MRLRVLDFGLVGALRSQAVYHGLAETVTSASEPMLSLASPDTPYVCVGLHQEIAREVDTGYCAAQGLPVYRRHVGGGAVYLDRDQLFTRFVFPRARAPRHAAELYPLFIEPVLRTYRDFGIAAQYRPINDIHVDGRKIGGTGAASIGEATVMVGSFMYDFDTATMAKCLRVPSEKFRDKLRQTLNDHMTTMARELTTPPARDDLLARFFHHCHEVLGLEPEIDRPTDAEWRAIEAAEAELTAPDFVEMQGRKLVQLGVKIAADTHLTESAVKAPGGLIRVHLLNREGRVADLMISGDLTCLPPDGLDRLAAALKGVALDAAALTGAAAQVLEAGGIETPGVSPSDFAAAILAAVEPAP
ncbi:lipoate-protein ligase A [Rhodovulum iodosum]|uniref:Lipoate-protein ligase A n=1 Tax=Rhodovulum iodosum TaxID=68291 RepID=A0ABV3XWN5_9RHOB|nr:lipoate--protein ligase family protein [Rhodovulum robiginosum]RSK36485.1 lipoate--protein ligase family protein [Rhodovulum robiginosum]